LIDELIKSEKFKDEDRVRRFIRKMINEAAIYESTPGHYNTVRELMNYNLILIQLIS